MLNLVLLIADGQLLQTLKEKLESLGKENICVTPPISPSKSEGNVETIMPPPPRVPKKGILPNVTKKTSSNKYALPYSTSEDITEVIDMEALDRHVHQIPLRNLDCLSVDGDDDSDLSEASCKSSTSSKSSSSATRSVSRGVIKSSRTAGPTTSSSRSNSKVVSSSPTEIVTLDTERTSASTRSMRSNNVTERKRRN
jgi:hypothetical protein